MRSSYEKLYVYIEVDSNFDFVVTDPCTGISCTGAGQLQCSAGICPCDSGNHFEKDGSGGCKCTSGYVDDGSRGCKLGNVNTFLTV